VGERALWWLQRYLQHVRPEVLVVPDCRALFLAMDGMAGLTASGITMAVVPFRRLRASPARARQAVRRLTVNRVPSPAAEETGNDSLPDAVKMRGCRRYATAGR